jgi:Zn-dependent protease with chaperone function
MNQKALARFGYHNAFAYNPQTAYFLPIESISFLFVSEGFFEDLSLEEQRFLIGHELIHIKHGHLHYFHPALLLFFVALLICAMRPTKYVMVIIQKHFPLFYPKYIPWVITALLLGACVASTSLVALAYRRHIEREADCVSMQLLNSHAGCLLLTERWHKECKIALHNPYFGITADHPSCAERQSYCLALKQHQSIQKDLT